VRVKIRLMAKEADFYSPEEVAKALGIPERRVFGMLCNGELEGHQDEWARWRVPVSALHARRDPECSSEPSGSAGDDAAATAVNDRAPLWEPSDDTDALISEETTQEAIEAPSGNYAIHTGEEVTQRLPRDNHREAAVPDEAVREFAERLAAAEAEARELRTRLERAATAEATLRESLDRERRRADRESARAERERRAAERLQEELRAERNEGFWQRLFGG
jgi:hypothetical protein